MGIFHKINMFNNRCKLTLFFVCFCLLNFLYAFAQNNSTSNSVNVQAALSSLDYADKLYAAGEWQSALSSAQLGKVYDPRTADFYYLEALCGLKLKTANADILEKAQAACASGMEWRRYELSAGRLLCANISCKMKHYKEALSIIKLLPFASADSDYIRAASFYGLGKDEEARKIIKESMVKYAFDSRFAKLFFLMERGKKVTYSARKLIDYIMPRLYVWQEEDTSLLIFASPYEKKTEENVRRLKLYRNMYMPFTNSYDGEQLFNHSYSILLCLRYGIIDERTAITDFFNLHSIYFNPISKQHEQLTTVYESHLIELLRIVGSPFLRKQIRQKLSVYEGLVLDDTNNDQIVNTIIYYKNGRPLYAEFDTQQDGYPEYTVECNFGVPAIVHGKRNSYSVVYDEYPAVKKYKSTQKSFTMRPLDLKWEPIKLIEVNLRLYTTDEKAETFFSLKVNKKVEKLHNQYLTYSCVYSEEDDKTIEGGIKKVFYNKGVPIKAEVRTGNRIYSQTNYSAGVPKIELSDKNDDGYFETLVEYDARGNIKTLKADLNGNKFYEYTETYAKNGLIIKTWDNDEDNKNEIVYRQNKSALSRAEWLHPKTNKKIAVEFEDGIPYELIDGKRKRKIVPARNAPVYWLRYLPDIPEKVNEEIVKIFGQDDLKVVSYTFKINDLDVFAVRSGGLIFAELLEQKTR